MNKRTSARRAATFLAALGALVMSSGVALMVTATSANAADHGPDPKIVVCKYVDTPGGQLQTGNNPIEVSLNTLNNVVDDAWLNNPDRTFPKSWNDAHGQSGGGGSIAIGYTGEGLDISDCSGDTPPPPPPPPGVATASVTPVQATCTAAASYTTSGTHVASFSESAAPAAGTTITVTAHAESGYKLNGNDTEDFVLNFAAAPTNCTTVNPPTTTPTTPTTVVDAPKTKAKAETQTAAVTPTVVHAGLTSVSTKDMRGEQGLALMVSGMVMLAAAGGLGLRLRGAASRI